MKILVADDDALSRRILVKLLTEAGFEVVAVSDGTAAWAALTDIAEPPHIAVLDWMMPGLNGTDLCRRLRSTASSSYTYVILLTGKTSQAELVAGLEAGVDDYVRKPFHARELALRVTNGKRIVEMQAELRFRATRDALTLALNRGAVFDRLRDELSRFERGVMSAFSVALLDVDHFKRINDEHGHPAGDEVLREVARRLGAVVRPYDAVGRYGGEEFLVLLPHCSERGAFAAGERIRGAIAADRMTTPSAVIDVRVSVGVAAAEPGESLQGLVARADAGLYSAKRGGRNRVVVATTSGAAVTGAAA